MQVQWRGELLFISAGSFRRSRRKCRGRDGWGGGAGQEWVRAIWTRHIWRTNRNLGRQNIFRTFFFLFCFHLKLFWVCFSCSEQCEHTTRLSSDIYSHPTLSSRTGRAASTVLPDLFRQKNTTSLAPCLAFDEKNIHSFMPGDRITTRMNAAGSDVTNDLLSLLLLPWQSVPVVLRFYLKMFSLLPSFNREGLMPQTLRKRFQGNRIIHWTAIWLLRLNFHQKIRNFGIMWNKPSLISNEVCNPSACVGCF